MLKHLVMTLVGVVALSAPSFAADTAPMSAMPMVSPQVSRTAMPGYTTEQAAQAHCPSDTVVWVNMHSGAVHKKGSSYYGKTKHGSYACAAEVPMHSKTTHMKSKHKAMTMPSAAPMSMPTASSSATPTE